MSEPPKRVSFMTIESTSDFLKKPEKTDAAAGSKLKSVRMELDIFEPDEYKFPEFNYKKLIHIEKVTENYFFVRVIFFFFLFSCDDAD
jgi:hypothetical protein